MKYEWSNQKQVIEVPLLGNHLTVNVKPMSQTEEQMPKG